MLARCKQIRLTLRDFHSEGATHLDQLNQFILGQYGLTDELALQNNLKGKGFLP